MDVVRAFAAVAAVAAMLVFIPTSLAGGSSPPDQPVFTECAPNQCGGGGGGSCPATEEVAGYWFTSSVPSSSASVNLLIYSWTIAANGVHIAGYIGEDNKSNPTYWIQAGIAATTGLEQYIEYNSPSPTGYMFVPEGSASLNTSYKATVTKDGSGQWTASINGHALGYDVPLTARETQVQFESRNSSSGGCNYWDISFSSLSPYSTSQSDAVHQDAWPFYRYYISAHSWETLG